MFIRRINHLTAESFESNKYLFKNNRKTGKLMCASSPLPAISTEIKQKPPILSGNSLSCWGEQRWRNRSQHKMHAFRWKSKFLRRWANLPGSDPHMPLRDDLPPPELTVRYSSFHWRRFWLQSFLLYLSNLYSSFNTQHKVTFYGRLPLTSYFTLPISRPSRGDHGTGHRISFQWSSPGRNAIQQWIVTSGLYT